MRGGAIKELSVFLRSIVVIWLGKTVGFFIFYIILEEGR